MKHYAANDKAYLANADSVLEYWLGDGLTLGWPSEDMHKRWFGGGAALDLEITDEFGAQVIQAVSGALQDWEEPVLHRLALVILLDQFTRNVFRGSPRAFSGDARAQKLVTDAIAKGSDRQLPWVGRVFLYMPLMHAESVPLQDQCARCLDAMAQEAPPAIKAKMKGQLESSRDHRKIIEQFGRFPHRNAALGRESTPQEVKYLKKAQRFGQ